MKIIKNINNNYALAIDSAGKQLIVSGKGIGFGSVPREVYDITIINRSFYDIDESYISMIKDIPDSIIEIATEIIDKAREVLECPINSTIVFTLADHIHFSIQRYKKKMNIKLPIIYDIQYFFEKEMLIGEYGLKLIRKRLGLYLPDDEAACIALHIINAEEKTKNSIDENNDEIIETITNIIEKEYDIKINKSNFNYSRFVSHMHYLLKRSQNKVLYTSTNEQIYEKVKKDYYKSYQCVKLVCQYLSHKLNIELTDEEKLYLMLHINRLYTHEDCNQ